MLIVGTLCVQNQSDQPQLKRISIGKSFADAYNCTKGRVCKNQDFVLLSCPWTMVDLCFRATEALKTIWSSLFKEMHKSTILHPSKLACRKKVNLCFFCNGQFYVWAVGNCSVNFLTESIIDKISMCHTSGKLNFTCKAINKNWTNKLSWIGSKLAFPKQGCQAF